MQPIHEAATTGNLNRVRALLNQGVPVNARNHWGYTPLHYAARGGRLNIVQELLRHGARVNPRSSLYGATPLYWAAYRGHPRVVHELLKAGANPKYRNWYGQTPYKFALLNSSRNAFKTSRAATKWQNYRKKSIARKRASPNTLARTVFSPKRVITMIKKYGNNWLNKI
jgi:hypothetical protein